MAPSRRSRSALAEIKASPPNSQTRGSTNKKTEALGTLIILKIIINNYLNVINDICTFIGHLNNRNSECCYFKFAYLLYIFAL